jgi:DNA end-binding protein Ku
MARALWKGAITFGLVNIPSSSTRRKDRKSFQFSMLDKRGLLAVGYKRYSKRSGKEVDWQNVVKGYEYEKDQYVVLCPTRISSAPTSRPRRRSRFERSSARTRSAEYFETPYYLEPDKRARGLRAAARDAKAPVASRSRRW